MYASTRIVVTNMNRLVRLFLGIDMKAGIDIKWLKRALKHPDRAFEFVADKALSLTLHRGSKRYDAFFVSYVEGLKKLTVLDIEAVQEFRSELLKNRALHDHLKKSLAQGVHFRTTWNVDSQTGRFLYVVCRALKPRFVIETGVGNGLSSTFILQALHDNEKGFLYSVELDPCDRLIPSWLRVSREKIGSLIPTWMRDRWNLTLGNSLLVLEPILHRLGQIDIFFHDSAHEYRVMKKEFIISWPHVRPGGLIIVHDATVNSALLDFCQQRALTPVVFPPHDPLKKTGQLAAVKKLGSITVAR